jgi:hypothetical protein
MRRIGEPNGRYIWCPQQAYFPDKGGNMNIFYCNLHAPDGHVMNYGFKVDIDKEGYCAYD